jgi:hypothetical protein
MIGESLDKALGLCFGTDPLCSLNWAADAVNCAANRDPMLVVSDTGCDRRDQLARAGYVKQQRFRVLPSLKTARWILPVRRGSRACAGFEIYTPFSMKARIMKAVLQAVNPPDWGFWNERTFVIASKKRLPLEKLVEHVTGEMEVLLALSLGTVGAFQKLTIQAMRTDGTVLGYLKLPFAGTAALERLQNEATTVGTLALHPQMRPYIPQLLFEGSWEGRYVVFQSPLGGKVGPSVYGAIHDNFLRKLHSLSSDSVPGSAIVAQTADVWKRVANRFGTSWQNLGREVLSRAERDLSGRAVQCGLSHGDFTPWNTRVLSGELTVFDWESSRPLMPSQWDRFHFLTQTECLLKSKRDFRNGTDVRQVHRSLFYLYVLWSAATCNEECAAQKLIDYRQELLKELLA